jgi:hypothetical protein
MKSKVSDKKDQLTIRDDRIDEGGDKVHVENFDLGLGIPEQ